MAHFVCSCCTARATVFTFVLGNMVCLTCFQARNRVTIAHQRAIGDLRDTDKIDWPSFDKAGKLTKAELDAVYAKSAPYLNRAKVFADKEVADKAAQEMRKKEEEAYRKGMHLPRSGEEIAEDSESEEEDKAPPTKIRKQ